jgi:salicylate hydroxylase
VPIERVPVAVQMDSVVVWVGPDLHLVQYPLRRGAIYNQVAVFHSDRYTDDRRDDWGTAEELVEHFDPMCPPVASSIGLLDQSVRWPMYDRVPIDNWTAGAVTLLGDAAHPMLQYLAQGACQALEDAVQLGADFTPGRDAGEAFLAYQAERIPQTARVQRSARSWGELWHLGGVGRQVRNRYLGIREAADYSETDWLYGADAPLEPAAMTMTKGEAPR